MSYAEIKAFKVPVTCPSNIKERKKNGALDHVVVMGFAKVASHR